MRTEDVIKPARAIPTSTRAWLLAALALITPLGLILVNVAAYVMGHLAALLAPRQAPRALVVGLGAGATPGALAQHRGAQVDIIELSESVISAAPFLR